MVNFSTKASLSCPIVVIGIGVTKQVSNNVEQKNSLALELTEMGLSLFVCAGDEPVECVAYVSLDDPEFPKKLSTFRAAAEKTIGKGFETQIWLPDEQVMFRSLKLDEEDTDDLRTAASSALSASTPFHGDSLCFDLGDTNGAGYTPVAAIPKEKMDEAMAFAKKMRMNPRLITTSNVVSGFSSRPDFKPHAPEVVQRAAPVRMAALAMMLAAPIFLLSGELDTGPDGRLEASAGNAFVASILPVEAGPEAPELIGPDPSQAGTTGLPNATMDLTASRTAPQMEPAQLPSQPRATAAHSDIEVMVAVTPLAQTQNLSEMGAPAVNLPQLPMPAKMTGLPELGDTAPAPVSDAPISAQWEVSQLPSPDAISVRFPISDHDGFREIDTAAPSLTSNSQPGELPNLDMLTVEYVQNVFDGNITIKDLMAVEEDTATAFNNPAHDPALLRLANLGEGVLVRRPVGRAAPKLMQPAFVPRPEKRPLPLLPEQAFDYKTMIPIDPGTTIEDPPPFVSGAIDTAPQLSRPAGLIFRFDSSTNKLIADASVRRRRLAIVDAKQNQNGLLANLIPPRARTAVPLAGSDGGVIQFKAPRRTVATIPADPTPQAPQSDAPKPELATPERIAVPYILQPKLPLGLPQGAAQQVAAVRELVPFQPQTSNPAPDIQFVDVASKPALPRPPSRRTNLVVTEPEPAAELATVEQPTEETALDTAQSDTTSPSVQAEIAAQAAPNLTLPRPPSRPERSTDVAALILELDPPAQTGPISKYAIDQLYAPAKRPASLKAQAAKIIEERNSVTNQVAKKQEPVATTPQNRLRIPTGARVGATATIKDGIALGDISLIGIYGTSKTRRALVRLPQGRYVQITRGDQVSGWTVSAVGEDAVRIQKGSANKVLRLPN